MDKHIIDRQQSDAAIQLACAFRWAYGQAKFWKSILWGATFALAVIQVEVALLPGSTRADLDLDTFNVAMLIVVLLLSTLGKSFLIEKWQNRGCDLQQAHDHEVLQLGGKPGFLTMPPAQVKTYADRYRRKAPQDIPNLETWWSKAIANLPRIPAIGVCQLSTFTWEAALRKWYQFFLWVLMLVVLGLLAWLGNVQHDQLGQFMINLVAPATPFLQLIIEDLIANGRFSGEAAEAAKEAERNWRQILDGTASDREMAERLNAAQMDWQNFRIHATPIFGWLYWLSRRQMEANMNTDAQALADAYMERHPDDKGVRQSGPVAGTMP